MFARLPGGSKSVLEEQPNMKVMFYRVRARLHNGTRRVCYISNI